MKPFIFTFVAILATSTATLALPTGNYADQSFLERRAGNENLPSISDRIAALQRSSANHKNRNSANTPASQRKTPPIPAPRSNIPPTPASGHRAPPPIPSGHRAPPPIPFKHRAPPPIPPGHRVPPVPAPRSNRPPGNSASPRNKQPIPAPRSNRPPTPPPKPKGNVQQNSAENAFGSRIPGQVIPLEVCRGKVSGEVDLPLLKSPSSSDNDDFNLYRYQRPSKQSQ
ncbi:hypothetical protein BSLG_002380 [Batrachochytrium salamandrivorans]|nr:hypothetical protein BSLG_002380 [Batrachochytrium salamandrivorans]